MSTLFLPKLRKYFKYRYFLSYCSLLFLSPSISCFFFPPFFYLSSSSLFCCSVFPLPLSSLFPLLSTILYFGAFFCFFCYLFLILSWFLFPSLYSPSPFLPFSLCYPLLYFGAFFCFFCYLFLILSCFLFPSHSYSCFLHYSLFFAIPIPVSFSSFYISSVIHYLPFTLSPFSSLTFPLQYTVYKPFLSLPASCMAGYE